MDYDKLIAPAAREMRPSGIRKFFDLAADMPECISLGVGEPDFKTPWAVREAGIESLEHGRTRGGCHCDEVHGTRFVGTLFFPRVVRHFAGGLYRGYVLGTSY